MVRRKDTAARELRDADPTEAHARRLERACGTIRSALWMIDEHGNTLAVSDPVESLVGLSPAEVIAGGRQRFWSRIHIDDRDAVADALAAFFNGEGFDGEGFDGEGLEGGGLEAGSFEGDGFEGRDLGRRGVDARGMAAIEPEGTSFAREADHVEARAFDIELRMQHADGGWRWLSARPVATQSHEGTLYVELVVTDVTAQREADLKQQGGERRLQMLLLGSPVVCAVRRTSGSFAPTFVTPNVTALLGHSLKRLARSSTVWTRLVHPDDRGRALAAVRGALEAGAGVCEYRVLHQEGSYRWIRDEVRLLPLPRADGEEGGAELVSFWSDLTERKRWEHACQKLEATVSLLAGRSTDAILLTSNGYVTYANDAFAEACGVERAEDLSGVDVLGMVDSRDRSALASLLGDGEDRIGPAAPVALRWQKKRGGTVTLQCSALPSSAEGATALLLFGAPA